MYGYEWSIDQLVDLFTPYLFLCVTSTIVPRGMEPSHAARLLAAIGLAASVSLSGDFNDDGIIDAAAYTLW